MRLVEEGGGVIDRMQLSGRWSEVFKGDSSSTLQLEKVDRKWEGHKMWSMVEKVPWASLS